MLLHKLKLKLGYGEVKNQLLKKLVRKNFYKFANTSTDKKKVYFFPFLFSSPISTYKEIYLIRF